MVMCAEIFSFHLIGRLILCSARRVAMVRTFQEKTASYEVVLWIINH